MSGAKSEEDPTWHLVLYVVFVVGVVWLTWFFFRAELLEFVRYLRLAELWVISLFEPRYTPCVQWLRLAGVETAATNVVKGLTDLCFGTRLPLAVANDFLSITPVSMGAIARMTSPYVRWVAGGICLGFAVHAIFFWNRGKFRTRHNLESLIKTQAKMWPVISPIVNFKPPTVSARAPGQVIPDKLPVFAEALSPEEWMSFHRIPVENGLPDRDAVRRAFMPQLGPRWEGRVDNFPPYLLALYAAFCLKGVQRREESDDLLGRFSQHWTRENGFHMTPHLEAEVRKLALDPNVGGKGLEIANQHAWRTTAILGLLKWARFSGGVLAPAQFLWLRGVDRDVWYPLNNLGRRSFHSEGAGAMAHFLAETTAAKPLPVPRLDTAIITLNQYLAQNAIKIPPREEPPGTIVKKN